MALRVLLLAAFTTHTVAAYFESDLRELCAASRQPQLLLTSRGPRSAALLHLSDQHRDRCVLSVAVPYMHQLALRLFLQPEPPPPGTICPLSIVRDDDGALLPLCSSDGIPLERLRGRQVSLLWAPPANETAVAAGWAPTELLITALSRGRSCASPQLVTCRGRTRRASLCVSRALACDGYSNCPRGEDEAPDVCAAAAASTDAPPPHAGRDALSSVLAEYSPWGYLMLAMLVTGALLLLCGLWECCRRRGGGGGAGGGGTELSEAGQQPLPPHTATIDAAVFVVEPLPPPPPYESLDQPPCYDQLFPAAKESIA
ncbi:uncharacterized protein LOC126350301 [Schistocerca gregaria]|uniref:uncharacterized protein LOC126350301 n=1 Tax=Schistocerca gregaria TaxID=7010 RepID=UPI00211DECF6|nr:uncharacterized protein LOC126350301 [Schistocerca gregaria]